MLLSTKESAALLEQIGENISHLRLGAGMTQATLGEAVGVTQHQIQRYEAGRASLSVERLAAIARVLDVEPGRFFGRGHALRDLSPAQLGFGDLNIGLCSKEDLELAAKIARIRSDPQRRDILRSIEETAELVLRGQQGEGSAT